MPSDQSTQLQRYSVIPGHHARELVLLKSGPCAWGRCAFCDYIRDNSTDELLCDRVNASVLARVTGQTGQLEVINSGSVFELTPGTMAALRRVVEQKQIKKLYFECHWSYRHRLQEVRDYFGVPIVFKCGIETFDDDFRNRVLKKGIVYDDLQEVRRYFDSVCLLVGIQGQTKEMLDRDVKILLEHFPLGCINVFCENSTDVRADAQLAQWFCQKYAHLQNDPRIDFLTDNTDFGVG
ncbi:Uncharacterised protein [Anaerotruncus sp. 2789STDY5834896]|uniref:Elp3/MiaA/NifB-like radical SAM core domain-containing protein n=1 Tax=uncultured Anaerotruncus sp. TaxID=905011 RepID=A0A1C6GCD4_9FIRM|nr:Uncharacterised protein [uncultured Anaerotruncus sp.]